MFCLICNNECDGLLLMKKCGCRICVHGDCWFEWTYRNEICIYCGESLSDIFARVKPVQDINFYRNLGAAFLFYFTTLSIVIYHKL